MNRPSPRAGASLPLFADAGGPPQRLTRAPLREPAGLPHEARARLELLPPEAREALEKLYPTRGEDELARQLNAEADRQRTRERHAELARKTQAALDGQYGAEVKLRAQAVVAGGRTVQNMLRVERLVREAAMREQRNRKRSLTYRTGRSGR